MKINRQEERKVEKMIGERLQFVRKHYGIKQAELARLLDVSKFTVQSWEQEKSNPSHETLVKICQMYHVSADFLLGLSDELPSFKADNRVLLYKGLTAESQDRLNSYAEFLRTNQ